MVAFKTLLLHFSEKRDCHQTLTKGIILPCVKIKRGAQTPDSKRFATLLQSG
jgi:hypothetical protein